MAKRNRHRIQVREKNGVRQIQVIWAPAGRGRVTFSCDWADLHNADLVQAIEQAFPASKARETPGVNG